MRTLLLSHTAFYLKRRCLRSTFLAAIFVLAGAPAGAQLQPKMVKVEGGSYTMGDIHGVGNTDELPLREVQVASFWMQEKELSFAQYDAFCRATWHVCPEDYSWGRGDTLPVMGVSWYDALLYCNWLSRQAGFQPAYEINKLKPDAQNDALMDIDKWTIVWNRAANGYRLPTEAEWEFAAKGGTHHKSYPGAGGVHPDSVAWYSDNAEFRIQRRGTKLPNVLGLYDMSGNVEEWCWDWYAVTYNPSETDNPAGAEGGRAKVVRGGSWMDSPTNLRTSARGNRSPVERNMRHVGFRVVRNAD